MDGGAGGDVVPLGFVAVLAFALLLEGGPNGRAQGDADGDAEGEVVEDEAEGDAEAGPDGDAGGDGTAWLLCAALIAWVCVHVGLLFDG